MRTENEETAKLLDKAALICVTKHAGQRDKMGCAYFQHPMRVAMRCTTDEEKMVALLHDTIEDTDVTAEYLLAEGFPQKIVDAILSVTKRDGESYEDFVIRVKQNPLGRVVKLHDLEDNLDILRLDTLTPGMVTRYNKYLTARNFLLDDQLTEYPKHDLGERILECLKDSQPLSAVNISAHLGVEKSLVNRYLYDILENVAQNSHGWSIKS